MRRERKLSIEGLEPRMLLAGNVLVSDAGGVLKITGDTDSNQIEILATGTPGQFTVNGLAGTAINGGPGPFTANNVTRDFKVAMGDGDDEVTINGLANPVSLGGRLSVDTGRGNDVVNFQSPPASPANQVAGRAHFKLGEGEDALNISNVEFHGNATINLGPGRNTMLMANATVCRDLAIHGREDVDDIRLDAVDVDRSLMVNSGRGFDEIRLLNAAGISRVGRDVQLRTGEGNDLVEISNVDIARDLAVDFAGGDDQLFVDPIAVGGTTTVGRDFRIRGGAGDDTLNVRQATVQRDLKIAVGSGHSVVDLVMSEVARNFFFLGESGNDTLNLGSETDDVVGLNVAGRLDVLTGAGNDVFTVYQSQVGGRTSVQTGSNNDTMQVDASVFHGSVRVKLGKGADALSEGLGPHHPGGNTFNHPTVVVDGGLGFDTGNSGLTSTFAAPPVSRNFEAGNMA